MYKIDKDKDNAKRLRLFYCKVGRAIEIEENLLHKEKISI